MRDLLSISMIILTITGASGCLIPDTEIQVYATQECGHQFSASTNWASGVDGVDGLYYILIDDEPIMKKWCLKPDEAELMQFPQSWIYQQVLDDIIATCEARALDMALGDDNCSEKASVTYSGTCPGKNEWCEDADANANDEVGVPDLPPN